MKRLVHAEEKSCLHEGFGCSCMVCLGRMSYEELIGVMYDLVDLVA